MIQLALSSPIVTASSPAARTSWEATGTIADLATVAHAADRLGYTHMTCSEHVAVPAEALARRGGRYWDPLPTFGYLAAVTERIRFATLVLVLGYHHPLAIAKRYGTLDVVTGGRLTLGVGVGTLTEEFELLDVPFDDRGARADDALRALRASLSQPEPAYRGEFYDYEGMVIDPCAVQAHVPIWVGGRTRRSLRRALTLGDGWCPFALDLDLAAGWLAQAELPAGFEVVLAPPGKLDPIDAPDRTATALATAINAGATTALVSFDARSVAHQVEMMEAMAAIAAAS